ncbi:hypothetical protein BAnh1_09980 [Bartonella australis AUST/NH1]|uniref:Alpha/beta hydrolase n=1 Tax=Bartonella australis (strain Aust/NH1) TaxID=1094489 RepID=M1NU89_BARAA|nr:alpha/beta hydrolase [Bartonella australis]AGF74868.1 hypothetical protein BAnh1_09980 [Bartonella australis AUST/NH1]
MKKKAVILSPIMPLWDDGRFCLDIQNLLLKNDIDFTILDTPSLLKGVPKEDNLALVEEEIKRRFNFPILLIGFSMAGTLAQMLAYRLANVEAVISLSGPGYADDVLKKHIGALLLLLEDGALCDALELLHRYAQPVDTSVPLGNILIPEEQKAEALDRMKNGFKLLLEMDARTVIGKFKGKFLSLVGAKSQLATVKNQTASVLEYHEYHTIKNAGARLWRDDPTIVGDIINSWIKKI